MRLEVIAAIRLDCMIDFEFDESANSKVQG